MDFFNYRLVVFTHCSHTTVFKHLIKVFFFHNRFPVKTHLASLIEKDHSNQKECEGYDDANGQAELRKCWDGFLYLNKMKAKRLSNHMSQYFIHNRT